MRACRLGRELTLHALSERAGVSERFLAQLEAGQGNISVARLCDVAHALGTSAARLLEGVGEGSAEPGVVALLGLRGAGKSTIGPRLAQALSVPFVELDQLVERAAGMTLGEVFELQGEAFYRRLERETLRRVFADHPRAVIATGGSIVGDAESFDLLRRAATTVLNGMLKVATGFQGTDTHGLKAFRRDSVLPVVEACVVDKDMFASELVVRVHRDESLRWTEVPIDLVEKRPPSIHLFKRVPNVLRNMVRLTAIIRFGRDLK